jgi:hypothetical protein
LIAPYGINRFRLKGKEEGEFVKKVSLIMILTVCLPLLCFSAITEQNKIMATEHMRYEYEYPIKRNTNTINNTNISTAEIAKIKGIIFKEFSDVGDPLNEDEKIQYYLQNFEVYSAISEGKSYKLIIAEAKGSCESCDLHYFILCSKDYNTLFKINRRTHNNGTTKIEFHDLGCNGGLQISFFDDGSWAGGVGASEYEIFGIQQGRLKSIFKTDLYLFDKSNFVAAKVINNFNSVISFGKCKVSGYVNIYITKENDEITYKAPRYTEPLRERKFKNTETWIYWFGKYRLQKTFIFGIKIP